MDECMFFRCVEYRSAQIKTHGYFGQIFVERIDDCIDIPHEDSGIPEKLATFIKYFSQFQIRLFRKRFHLSNAVGGQIAALNIPVPCFRATRTDSHR